MNEKVLKKFFNTPTTIKKRKNRQTSTINIYSKENLIKFRKEIGFLHEKKKKKLDGAIDSFVNYGWQFPKEKPKLKVFIKQKMQERAKIHKPKHIQMCSIVRDNLDELSKNLFDLFAITANVYGPRFNSLVTKYFDFKICNEKEVQKAIKEGLLAEKQAQRFFELKN